MTIGDLRNFYGTLWEFDAIQADVIAARNRERPWLSILVAAGSEEEATQILQGAILRCVGLRTVEPSIAVGTRE